MLGLLARLLGGALDPLVDRAAVVGARLLRKLALFLLAAICLVVVLIALTIAFDLWVASKLGAIAGALAVAGVYLAVAVAAIVLALRGDAKPSSSQQQTSAGEQAAADATRRQQSSRKAQVDAFAAPLMRMLAGLGLRREQLAVLAGSSLAKQLGPLPLVGLALVGGFLIGRMGKSLRALLSTDALTSLLAAVGLFGAGDDDEADEDSDEADRSGDASSPS